MTTNVGELVMCRNMFGGLDGHSITVQQTLRSGLAPHFHCKDSS